MGLLEKLLHKLKRKDDNAEQAHEVVMDILFDWFNENNDSVETFVKEFLHPCINVYAKNKNTKAHLDAYPDKAFEQYFIYHAIFYLAANYPNQQKFKALLDYLTDKENRAYTIINSIRNAPSQYQFNQDFTHLWNVLMTGNSILKIYHAIHDKRDANLSYISALHGTLKNLSRKEHKEIFSRVFDYFKLQEFEDKLFVLSNSLPSGDLEINDQKALNLFKEEIAKALDSYNKKNEIQISEEVRNGFHKSFFEISSTDIYKNTDYKKKKHLKLEQFPEAINFLSKNSLHKVSIIKYYLIHISGLYLSTEMTKIHNGLYKQLLKNLKLNAVEFKSLLSTKLNSNRVLVYNGLFAPMLQDASIIENFNTELLDHFEKIFLDDTSHFRELSVFQPIIDAIQSRKTISPDRIIQSLEVAKNNKVYGAVNFDHNYISPNIENKKEGEFAINFLIAKLNLIYPSSLKFLPKQIQHVYYESTLCTINIDGQDYHFTRNIIVELNELLDSKKAGYRFIPLSINKNPNLQNNPSNKNSFRCTFGLLNYEQFAVLLKTMFKDHSLLNTKAIQNITYHNQEAPLLNFTNENTSNDN